ncbi:hypothetical protein BaRGS_00002867 [Batillaria attramentaria]|uniref:Uncharacterized protein n=1 Tax=Batillaria attramentaria TaxID=370345 RepID=A0ABD0M3T9_9CAEN
MTLNLRPLADVQVRNPPDIKLDFRDTRFPTSEDRLSKDKTADNKIKSTSLQRQQLTRKRGKGPEGDAISDADVYREDV